MEMVDKEEKRKKDAVEEMTEKTILKALAEGPTSISTCVRKYSYDVFLSFRGDDTRHNFTGNLYYALCQKGVNTFIDDEGLERGEEISPALIKAIEESKASIVIFSENYASSPWCLNELVKILECKREKGQMVWPIFYKVDPCDVRHQRNSYKEAMTKHENRFKSEMEKVKRWRSALNEAANLSGWTFTTKYEFEFVSAISSKASAKLHCRRLHIGEHIIGLDSHLKEVLPLLNIQDDDAGMMLGIHGIGGIGKTSLAKVLFNLIVDHFDFACFLESVRERSKSGMDLVNVQEKLLCQMFGEKNYNLDNVDEGAYRIKHMLCTRRVLIVLDDVDKIEQLERLAGGCDWFGLGSKIIITTRDKHLLITHGITKMYETKELSYDHALELFCWKAFRRNHPDGNFIDISNRIVNYAMGLPLALKVIGSNLFGKSLKAWDSALGKYERSLDKGIQEILRVSYDSLDDDQKNIFLDIACFFKGERLEIVEKVLDACDLSPQYNIEALVDKSLISLEVHNFDTDIFILGMHDLIQEMGKEVVRQDASSKICQYSRLWNHEDILNILNTNSGSDSIHGIMFHPDVPEKVEWSGTAFEKMSNLRIVIVRNAEFSIGPKSLPNSLRMLIWDRYSSEVLPEGFNPRRLVVLNLCNSHIVSLKPFQKFETLTCMNISGCEQLTLIPDMARAPNLTTLNLAGCTNLKALHDSVGGLTKLLDLNLGRCVNLEIIPDMVGASNLETLRLVGCTNLKALHDSVGNLTKLLDLDLEGCINLEIFPRGIRMTSLRSLNLKKCRSLQHFPDILEPMVHLSYIVVEGAGIKQIPDSIYYLSGLQSLYLSDCYDLVSLPESIYKLDKLISLHINDCKKLSNISWVPQNSSFIMAQGCISLTSESSNTLWSQVQHEVKFEALMPRTHIPNWFNHRCKGGSLSFWARRKFPEFAFAVVFGTLTNKISSEFSRVKILRYIDGSSTGVRTVGHFGREGGTLLLGQREHEHVPNFNTHNWNHVEIKCTALEENYEIDECGVYIYKQDINMEDIQFECPIPHNSNVDTAMSKEDEEVIDKIEEAKLRKGSLFCKGVIRTFMKESQGKSPKELGTLISGVYMSEPDINTEDIQFECPIPRNSNMDTVMSREEEEVRDKIEEAKPRKRSHTEFMSRNDEYIHEVKAGKESCRVMSRNGKQLEADKLPRFIKIVCCVMILGFIFYLRFM